MPQFITSFIAAALLLTLMTSPARAEAEPWVTALEEAIASRDADQRSRDRYRNPYETMAFFRVKPGMTVAEGLPGGGWYTRILADYLGADGTLYGVDYAHRMWPMFSWATDEWIAERKAAMANFPERVASFTDNGLEARGFTFESVPAEAEGTVDRVLLIRALHNLFRFEEEAGTLTAALEAIDLMLTDDGLIGVVQHRAPESVSDESARGHRGYLKQSAVIGRFESAGFELVETSEINANPKDDPGEEAIVWRLPPSLRGSEDDSERREKMLAIGESDRMTLLFRKKAD
ncbi:MAG: methyltransferase [Halioglobus sp.]|nr:methyltransferase [Halioglobus sp.]